MFFYRADTAILVKAINTYFCCRFVFACKAIAVDMEKNYDRRQRLAAMLLPDDPDRGRSVNCIFPYTDCHD